MIADRPQTPPAKIVAAIDRLARAQRAHRQVTASRLGLSLLQLDILITIADGPPPKPLVGLIANELGVSQPTVTDSLLALEKKGLIRRQVAEKGRRNTLAVITRKGTSTIAAARAEDDTLTNAIGRLDHTTQATAVTSLLGIVTAYLDADVINQARTCLTCRYHETTNDGANYCNLLQIPLAPIELRINCPEHQPELTSAR